MLHHPVLLRKYQVSFISFCLFYLSGSPAIAIADERTSAQDIQTIREFYDFDRSTLVQYADWLWNAAHLNFGQSYYFKLPVADLISSRLGVTMRLDLTAIVFALPDVVCSHENQSLATIYRPFRCRSCYSPCSTSSSYCSPTSMNVWFDPRMRTSHSHILPLRPYKQILEPSPSAILRCHIFGHSGFMIGTIIVTLLTLVAILALIILKHYPWLSGRVYPTSKLCRKVLVNDAGLVINIKIDRVGGHANVARFTLLSGA